MPFLSSFIYLFIYLFLFLFFNFLNFLFCLFAISWAAPEAYGGSQARGRIGAVATPEPQQRGIQAASATYTTDHGNARSLTY